MSTIALPFPLLPSVAGRASDSVPSRAPAMQVLSDRALVERAAGGDTDAFAALYRRYERPVFGVLLRLAGGRRALAEEWLQEAFTRVWLGAATHDPARGEVRPWIYKIALNTARSELARKRNRLPHVSLDEAGLDLPDADAGEKGVAARLDEALAEVRACGKGEAVALDVSDRASVEKTVAHVVQTRGRLDHLVNNAGITRDNLLLRMKDEEWQQVMATNLTGVFLCTQAAL
jgi:NAD(P)-dependent dehydrogenase (short-subunit alcohol dehydrogenase family)